jgi:hypothetical protein
MSDSACSQQLRLELGYCQTFREGLGLSLDAGLIVEDGAASKTAGKAIVHS